MRQALLWQMLRRQKKWLIGALVFFIVNALAILAVTQVTVSMVDKAIVERTDPLGPYIGRIIGLAFISFVVGLVQRLVTTRLSYQLEFDVRTKLYDAVQSAPPRTARIRRQWSTDHPLTHRPRIDAEVPRVRADDRRDPAVVRRRQHLHARHKPRSRGGCYGRVAGQHLAPAALPYEVVGAFLRRIERAGRGRDGDRRTRARHPCRASVRTRGIRACAASPTLRCVPIASP